jgi:8-oxo-dGTP diphosphatase
MIYFRNVGVFAIIADAEENVLLARRADIDAWNLPGGGRETHETLQETLQREVFEEVGLNLSSARIRNLSLIVSERTLAITYECRCLHYAARPSPEAIEVAWFDLDHLPPNILLRHAERLRAWRSKRFALIIQDRTEKLALLNGVSGRR